MPIFRKSVLVDRSEIALIASKICSSVNCFAFNSAMIEVSTSFLIESQSATFKPLMYFFFFTSLSINLEVSLEGPFRANRSAELAAETCEEGCR